MILNTNYVEKVSENGSGNERAHGLEIPIPITNAHVVRDRNAAQTQLTTKMQLNDKNSAYIVEDQTPESESEQDQQLKPGTHTQTHTDAYTDAGIDSDERRRRNSIALFPPSACFALRCVSPSPSLRLALANEFTEYLDSFDFKSKSTPEVISNGGRSDEDNNDNETIAPTSMKAYHSFPNFESFTPQNHNDNNDNDSHDNDDPNDDDDNDTITILAPIPQHPKTTLAIQALTHNLSEYTLHNSNTVTATVTAAAAAAHVDRANEQAFFTHGHHDTPRATCLGHEHLNDGDDRKTALVGSSADDAGNGEFSVFL